MTETVEDHFDGNDREMMKMSKSMKLVMDSLNRSLASVRKTPESSDSQAEFMNNVHKFIPEVNEIFEAIKPCHAIPCLANSLKATKCVLGRLNNNLENAKFAVEKQGLEARSLMSSICSNLTELDKFLNDKDSNTPSSKSNPDITDPIWNNARRQLDKGLEKLQNALNSSSFTSPIQVTGRSVADLAYVTFNSVAIRSLEVKEEPSEIQKLLKDSQQLMKWTLEILVNGNKAFSTNTTVELKSTSGTILNLMDNITKNIKFRKRDKRTQDDLQIQMKVILNTLNQMQAKDVTLENESNPDCEEEVMGNLSELKEKLQDILFDIRDSLEEQYFNEAEDQVKELVDTLSNFCEASRVLVSMETNPSKTESLIIGCKEVVNQATKLVKCAEHFEQMSTSDNRSVIRICDAMDETLDEILEPLEAEAENKKIINIFVENTKRICEGADKFAEEPSSLLCGEITSDVTRFIHCLQSVLKRETHPDLQVNCYTKTLEIKFDI